MEVNFGENAVPATEVAATATPVSTPTPAPSETVSTAPAGSQLPATTSGLTLGDKLPDFKDIILPRLNLVQNLGAMTESFESGSLVYNQQAVVYIPGKINSKTQAVERPPTAPVIMTVLGFKDTKYCEKVKWGGDSSGARGIIVDTEQAVRAAGGTLDYNEWKLKEKDGMKRFEPLADCLVAIERPEICKDDGTVFNFEVGPKKYALAMWGLRGTLYTAAAKRVFFTARRMGCLRQGYPMWSYAVSTREEKWQGGVQSWIPICIANQPNTPEFLDFVRSILGA